MIGDFLQSVFANPAHPATAAQRLAAAARASERQENVAEVECPAAWRQIASSLAACRADDACILSTSGSRANWETLARLLLRAGAIHRLTDWSGSRSRSLRPNGLAPGANLNSGRVWVRGDEELIWQESSLAGRQLRGDELIRQ
jgi:hypothetical protein